MADIRIDRAQLKEVVNSLKRPPGQNEWCVACGAGAASVKLELPEQVAQGAARQLLDAKELREFVASIKDVGEQAWCVACGAGAAASPLDRQGLPIDVTDEAIETLAKHMTKAIRLE